MGDANLTSALLMEGAHYEGHLALSQGAILTGLVWGAIVADVIDGRFRMAGAFAVAGGLMSSIGIIHSYTLQMPQFDGITIGYLIIGAFSVSTRCSHLKRISNIVSSYRMSPISSMTIHPLNKPDRQRGSRTAAPKTFQSRSIKVVREAEIALRPLADLSLAFLRADGMWFGRVFQRITHGGFSQHNCTALTPSIMNTIKALAEVT